MAFKKAKQIFIAFIIFLVALPAIAEPINPTGLWEADDGESRYEVSLCGDGTQLCAKLIWIRPDVTNERNSVYIDTYVVNGAKRKTDREWRGNISLYGHTVSGNVQAYSQNKLVVRGCALLVICIRKGLTRIASKD